MSNAWIRWGIEHKYIQPSNLFRVKIQDKTDISHTEFVDIRAVSKSEIKRRMAQQHPSYQIVQIDQIKTNENTKWLGVDEVMPIKIFNPPKKITFKVKSVQILTGRGPDKISLHFDNSIPYSGIILIQQIMAKQS